MSKARDDRKRTDRLRGYLLSGTGVLHDCPSCGARLRGHQGHYVPPSLGEEGRYVCGSLTAS